ncbi:MAG: DUF4340 domain-containing protein [Defluviitaleaceae bacterium]|nr:DUF4340 domain-containing protein [Defluviitaleaceae bacterium]
MSKSRKNLITLGALLVLTIALIAAYLVISNQQEQQALAAELEAAENPPAVSTVRLTEFTEDDLLRATFSSADGTFTLQRHFAEDGTNTWFYAEFPDVLLDQNTTRQMVRDVFMLTATDTVMEQVDNPQEFGIGNVVATGDFADGSQATILLGNLTPDHSRFFAMMEGDSALYLINTFSGNRLQQGLYDLVDMTLPFVNTMELLHIYISERGRQPLEFIASGTEEEILEMVNQFGATTLTMIYPFPDRDLTMTNFDMFVMQGFANFTPSEVYELFPTTGDLQRLGFAEPSLEFIMQDANGGFHLIFGDNHDDEYIYMMYADRPHVFLAPRADMASLLGINPFNFIERFVALLNIVDVEGVTITSPTRGNYDILINNFQDENERAQIAPTVNGREVVDSDFRRAYQSMIGITIEQEVGEQAALPATPDVTIVYHMLDGEDVTVEFFVHDANFYLIRQDGLPVQFVTSRLAMNVMFDTLGNLL